MAALQSSTEGHPPNPSSRSFLDILTNQPSSNSHPRPITHYRGYPSISFSEQDITCFSAPFRHALIGKFSNGRPPMESIRKSFISIGFTGSYTLGLINYQHILIKFQLEEDYVRAFLKRIYSIDSFPMRLFKWSPQFSVDSESAILPIWINFPLLPLHFFHKEALYNIARLIGDPLKMDASTTSLSRPSVARVCVELDLRKSRPEKIWIVNGSSGFWQTVEYEKIPPLCSNCNKIGHLTEACKSADLRPAPPAVAVTSKDPLRPKMRTEYRPKQATASDLPNGSAEKDAALLTNPFPSVKNSDAANLSNVADSVQDVGTVAVVDFAVDPNLKQSNNPMPLTEVKESISTQLSPLIKNPASAKMSSVAAAGHAVEAKESCSSVGVSNCLSAPPQTMDKHSSVPSDLLAVFPLNDTNIPSANSRNLDFVAYPADLIAVCQANDSASPLDSTSHMFFNGIQRPMFDAFDSDPNVMHAVTMDSSDVVVADVAKVPLSEAAVLVAEIKRPFVHASAPSSSGVLNPLAPLFTPRVIPYAESSRSFVDALLGEQQPPSVSLKPRFLAVKSAEFPLFQLPQFGDFYPPSSLIPPAEADSLDSNVDMYVFSDGDDVPRVPSSKQLLLASLQSFNNKLQSKFCKNPKFLHSTTKRKKWKKLPPFSLPCPTLSLSIPPPLHSFSIFYGPNPNEEQSDDNVYDNVWRSSSSEDESTNVFDYPLASIDPLMALEYEDFSLSPPPRRKYNKRFRDLPPALSTRRSKTRD